MAPFHTEAVRMAIQYKPAVNATKKDISTPERSQLNGESSFNEINLNSRIMTRKTKGTFDAA